METKIRLNPGETLKPTGNRSKGFGHDPNIRWSGLMRVHGQLR